MRQMRKLVWGLPIRRFASGALIQNSIEEVLLVEPTYKPDWEIPGGRGRPYESTRRACRRELHEELGLKIELGRCLVADLKQVDGAPIDHFIFDGGILAEEEITSIRLPPPELRSYRFVPRLKIGPPMVSDRLARRIGRALDALEADASD